MSKPVIAVFAVVAIAAGGYTAFWFKKADEFKNSVIQSAVALNEKAKPLLKGADAIRYESVVASGFPFGLTLTINKPIVTLPVDAIMRALPKETFEGQVPEGFSWIEEISYVDGISLSRDLLGSKHTVVINGDRVGKSVVNGQVRHAISSSSSSPLVCNLVTEPSGFLAMSPIFKDAASFTANFHSADCGISGLSVKDTTSGGLLASADKYYISFGDVVIGGKRATTFKFQSSGVKYTPAIDAVFNDYLHIASEASGMPMKDLPYSFSEFGDSSANIDVAYNGPSTEAGFSDKQLKFSFDVNAFDFHSNLFHWEQYIHVATEPQGTDRKAIINMHSKANVSERYDQMLATQVRDFFAELAKTEGKSGKNLMVATKVATLGSPDALVVNVLPRFHPLGDMVFDVNANLEGPNDTINFFTQGHGTLSAIDILTAPYGLKTTAAYSGSKGKALPSGNIDFNCINCDALIDDAGNYITRFTAYLSALEPEKKVVLPTKELYDGIKAFVHSIALNSEDKAAKDLHFNIVMKDTGDVTISGKPVMEAMQAYMTFIVPHLPVQPAPEPVPADKLPPMLRPQ